MKKMLLGFIMDGKSGGVDNYILHFLEAVKEQEIQIDLLTNEADPVLKEQLRKSGSRLFEITTLKHPVKQLRQVRYLIRKEQYDTVYFNISTAMDCIAAFAALSCKVPRRILHSHSGGNDCESVQKRVVFNLLQKISRNILYLAGNEFYACSRMAGYWMYPKRIVESEKFHVICNAADQERFRFRPDVRTQMRRELGINDAFVVGHAGNFCYQKNHLFLIQVFEEIQKKEPDAVLLLVGKGVRWDMIREQVQKAGLEKNVRFLGWRADVDRLFQAMDVFVLPSHFEGLPTVGIEAQCTGLPCVMSDTITTETKITEQCYFLPLKSGARKWAEEVLALKGVKRQAGADAEAAKLYTLDAQKEELERMVRGKGEQDE